MESVLKQKVVVCGDAPSMIDSVCKDVFGNQYVGKTGAFEAAVCEKPICVRVDSADVRYPDAINIYFGSPRNPDCYDIIIGSNDPIILTKEMKELEEIFQKGCSERIVKVEPARVFPTQKIRDFSESTLLEYENELVKDPETHYKITGNCIKGNWYVFDGHHRLAAEIRQKSPLIQVELEKEGYSPLEKSDFYDFEDLCGFRYSHYPEPVQQIWRSDRNDMLER